MDEKTIEAIVEKTVLEIRSKNSAAYDMNLKTAEKICGRVMEKAEEMGIAVVVSVFNKSANPVIVKCMDDAYIASYDIAVNKAYTCAALKMDTADLKKLANPGGELYGIQFTNGGKIVVFGGGSVLKLNETVVGGLGVSGGTEAQDTFLSEFGAEIFSEEIKCL